MKKPEFLNLLNLRFLKNRLGVEIAFNTVIMLILMLIVLGVIISFFLGSAETGLKPIGGFVEQSSQGLEQATEGLP